MPLPLRYWRACVEGGGAVRWGRRTRLVARAGHPDRVMTADHPAREGRRDAQPVEGNLVGLSESDGLQRDVLPIPDSPFEGTLPYDAKDPDASFPAVEPLRPPA